MLHQTAFRHGHDFTLPNDEVVEYAYVNQLQCAPQALGERFVGTARFRDPRGVVMRKYDRRGIVQEGAFNHLTRIHTGRIEGPPEKLLETDNTVSRRNKQAKTSCGRLRIEAFK